MKEFAAFLFGVMFVFLVVVTFAWVGNPQYHWHFERSPNTGICYEAREDMFFVWWGRAMSPVDDSYCKEENDASD